MALPLKTTLDDIIALCTYFSSKPTGATVKDAKAVLGSTRLDPRKTNALKFLGFLEEHEQRLKITPEGRAIAKNTNAAREAVFIRAIRNIDPYRSIVERAAYQNESSLTTTDVAAHWYDHFRDIAGGGDETLNDQAVCFFHVAQGAGLGTLVLGKRQPTRIDFDEEALAAFINEEGLSATETDELHTKEEAKSPIKPASAEDSKGTAEVKDDKTEGSLVVKADEFSRALTTQHISSLNDY